MASPGPAAGRNRYVDLVRLAAIVVVVVGHWLVTTIVLVDGRLVGQSALAVVGYARWLTLLLQVMPMFFLAGGYAAAAAWPSWRARGGGWAGWTHNRIVRLGNGKAPAVVAVKPAASVTGRRVVRPAVTFATAHGVIQHSTRQAPVMAGDR